MAGNRMKAMTRGSLLGLLLVLALASLCSGQSGRVILPDLQVRDDAGVFGPYPSGYAFETTYIGEITSIGSSN